MCVKQTKRQEENETSICLERPKNEIMFFGKVKKKAVCGKKKAVCNYFCRGVIRY